MAVNHHTTNPPLNPTFTGYIPNTIDALILFEACLLGRLNHVPRRPHDRERPDLIKSGMVFIYEEHASGIKRWTDGVSWSPSRILGNFLIYRELDKPFPPGEKKRALKKNRKPQQQPTGVNKSLSTPRQGSNVPTTMDPNAQPHKEEDRALVGSLVDSYPFKDGGLVKKTISVTYNGVPHHIVSYYSCDDVENGSLINPSRDSRLQGVIPRSELLLQQNFRAPIDESDPTNDGITLHPMYAYQGRGVLQQAYLQSYPSIAAVPSQVQAQVSAPAQAYHYTPAQFPMPYAQSQDQTSPQHHQQQQQHAHQQQQQQQHQQQQQPQSQHFLTPGSYAQPSTNFPPQNGYEGWGTWDGWTG